MDLLPIATCILGFAGGVGTTLVSHRLKVRDEHHRELRTLYGEWLAAAEAAVEEQGRLAMFDHVERQRRRYPEARDISSSPQGLTRQEQVTNVVQARERVKEKAARLVMVERSAAFTVRVERLTDIRYSERRDSSEIERVEYMLDFRNRALASLAAFRQDLREQHPNLKAAG